MAPHKQEVRTLASVKHARALFPSLSLLQYQHALLVRRDALRRTIANGALPRGI